MSPEPTTPTREELLRWCDELIAAQEAFDEIYARQAANNGDADILREFDDKAEALDALKEDEVLIGVASWIKQHLTSEPAGPTGWRCFHCNEVFTDHETARLHFGSRPEPFAATLCTESNMAKRLRDAEDNAHEMYRLKTEAEERLKPEPLASVPVTRGLVAVAAYWKTRCDTLGDNGGITIPVDNLRVLCEALLAASTGARDEAIEDAAKLIIGARDLLRNISLQRKKFGPIATAAQSRAWELSKCLALIGAKQP